ncbi:hypothetical protein ACIRPH_01805 [Nocardiopsis sp. NPDC101807]|uniref:hypothetical protein n=1 Tax=Nocardiopsis sp. NPDC101807 TaxID=3364339 RepID=UPI0038165999
MTGRSDGSGVGPFDPAPGHESDIDDVDADMDVGAADQDTAVAEYLADHPYGLRIEELEDHDALGIGAELRQEDPERVTGPEEEQNRGPDGEDLTRVLGAEEFADGVRDGDG